MMLLQDGSIKILSFALRGLQKNSVVCCKVTLEGVSNVSWNCFFISDFQRATCEAPRNLFYLILSFEVLMRFVSLLAHCVFRYSFSWGFSIFFSSSPEAFRQLCKSSRQCCQNGNILSIGFAGAVIGVCSADGLLVCARKHLCSMLGQWFHEEFQVYRKCLVLKMTRFFLHLADKEEWKRWSSWKKFFCWSRVMKKIVLVIMASYMFGSPRNTSVSYSFYEVVGSVANLIEKHCNDGIHRSNPDHLFPEGWLTL